MEHCPRLLFLPGASGDVTCWKPVARRLRHGGEPVHLCWPGFGPRRRSGVLALQAALARPERVTHLILAATSGGLTMAEHGAQDWRPAFRAAHSRVPKWFATGSKAEQVSRLIDRHLSSPP
ncbi:hypothetical protein NZK32_09085 [Cyanobium sp. FGCU-52]|nr:hypothetical protein [Cyanobium sp. FGCU52]